ncbi:ATP-dependent DNA helicase RecG [Halocella sp. SP3-1]|uniref:ATP-dependent DNA helicase RecG n=1 Tax=Halocella sp. SP3-1 TaxID=2382161 RepID=UPI000F75BF76|nr:ATP-dependent DNA helicase RecG [Halocella sp. SP3-1]AZO95232.1 ATP-dependent DNA helicase RecG [Halocella sp. SP3-1]
MKNELPKSVQFIKGVGPAYKKLLGKLNITTVEDLLYYFPRDYQDRSKYVPMNSVKPGQEITIKGKVLKIYEQKIKRGLRILKVTISDGSDCINGTWFNQSYLKKKFQKGKEYIFSGKLSDKAWGFGKKEINNPVFEELESGETIHTGRVVPIYALTEGISQQKLREIMYKALSDFACHVNDILPDYLIKRYKFPDIATSLWGLHFPRDRKHYIAARKRLAFEELFLLQLLVLQRKKNLTGIKGVEHKEETNTLDKFQEILPFKLTTAQQRVWTEIKKDMAGPVPMQRLLQGDVGSGKTIIAAMALVETMANTYQGIMMAPTEILAEQHYLKLKPLLRDLGFNVVLLTGSLKESERSRLKELIKNKEVDLIIGTHALFQEDLEYYKIGLIVIDEQHRFGVEQRFKLKDKGDNPDLLVMTATPIPRTLALTLYGDMDLSIIDELPPGRSPVITTWRTEKARSSIYSFVKEKINKGRQVYIVCPLIEESEEIDAVSAMKMFKTLTKDTFSQYRLGLLHSKITQEERKTVMKDFREGKIDILISTTVIEVGVDVPNASIMIIENAERFGLAQLHQLRGRVGRGKYQSYCILIANPRTEEGTKRLSVMTETDDGFKIAEADLEIRGPGEFFGIRQHGLPDLKVANILKDNRILITAREEAEGLINNNGILKYKYPRLYNKLLNLELKV